ncbi:MAG: RDD family protein [Bacteroidota bacterium]
MSQSIEIVTTQNVPIVYELAGLRDRALAFLLDSLIIWGGILVFGLLFLAAGLWDEDSVIFYWFFIAIPIFFFYTPLMEILNDGQTVGKMALRIKVVKLNGREVSLGDYLMRWVFRSIEIYFCAGSIASMMVSSSDKGQRLGDLLANTTVIRLQPRLNMTMSDLQRINTKENYQPRFPEVRKVSEEDMLLVKHVLERFQKFSNNAHKQALIETAEAMARQLHLDKAPNNKVEFLKVLLRDYIVLTR